MKKICSFFLTILIFPFEIYSQNGLTSYAVPPPNVQGIRYRYDLKVDAFDNVWMAFSDIGIAKFDGTNWTVYNSSNSSFPDTTAYAIAFDNMNNVWAGTNNGLAKFDGTNWSVFNTFNSGLPDNMVKAVELSGNNTWIGTNFGAVLYDGTNWTVYNTSNSGILSDTVSAFAFGNNGEVWIGTYTGLSKFYQGNWTNYNSLNSGLANQRILSLVVDNNNEIWIGSFLNFIYKMENGIIKNYITDLYNGTVQFIYANAISLVKNLQGNIVMTRNRGIAEITSPVPNIILFGKQIASIYPGFKNAYDSSGKLWIACFRASSSPVFVDSIFSFDMSQHGNYGYGITNDNFKYLDINNVKAAMMDFGMMHWDIDSGFSRYEVPKGSGRHADFSSTLWIGGLDVSGNLHLAAQTYRQSGIDFWPGPIDTLTGVADSVSTRPYDKIWKVNRFDIEDFKYNFLLGNVTNGTYTILPDMLSWPASGIGNITRNLAPYIDYNSDGVYNPFDGDYPKIKGDQMLYWIFNDNLSAHTNSFGASLGFEIHASAYAYTCPNIADSNSVMNTTTFYNYRIINRSNNNYDSLFVGLFSDVDVGSYNDDYIGCDTINNAGFGYNGDNDDNFPYGYGLNPPMQNVQVLKGPLADSGDGIDNDHDGTIDETGERCIMNHFHTWWPGPDPATDHPQSANDFYNYLHSTWRTGVHVTYGGSGYGGSIPTDYIFSGTPYDIAGWSETLLGDVPEDKRFVESSGPFSLAPGQETTIDFAYVFTWDSTAANGLTTSIARNTADLQRIKHWFDIDSFPSCLLLNVGTNQMEEGNNILNIYPNPANDKLYIQLSESALGGSESSYEVIDVLGKIFVNGKLKSNFVDTKQLTQGLYILQIHSRDKIYRKKFVKQ